MDKIDLISEIKRLSNLLDKQYDLELNFRNHCYLRIAYDNTVQNKWDLVLKKPFTKYANQDQLENVINLLDTYMLDKNKLLEHNKNSLTYRKNMKVIETLF